MSNKYREYFDIDTQYFPQINETTMDKVCWQSTYPHDAFVSLLHNVNNMLDGKSKRSIWIHGSYGTGKSLCALALKKILEASESELRDYWEHGGDASWPLTKPKEKDVLNKLLGHKQRRIVTAYRYGSGGINSNRDLLLALQESVNNALIANKIIERGEGTLKESVIKWLDDPLNKKHFDDYLQIPEFKNLFTQSSSDEVLAALRKGGELRELMHNLFYLAEKRNIRVFELTTENVIAWLKEILTKNDIKIVLVWDEFSAYFKKNRESLDQFQKLAELVEDNFYFVIVTHETGGLITNSDPVWSVVKQRFDFVAITLPDNIAFELISHAFTVKPEAKQSWETPASTLNDYLDDSRKAVCKAAEIADEDIIKRIMPLHPYAALILKYIATTFQSNQRSMFDFIKLENDDAQAFQWFIDNRGPEDDHPLLTVDHLWTFFYEKHKDDLTDGIRSILSVFPRQKNLKSEEQTVLKTILIMQAVDTQLGGAFEFFHVTKTNLSLAFNGINELEGSRCVNIANKLVSDGVLYRKPIGNNVEVFAVAALIGDQAKIDEEKKKVRLAATTAKLVDEGALSTLLPLTPALKMRFERTQGTGSILPVTASDFQRTMTDLSNVQTNWKIKSVIAFARDDSEVAAFRKEILKAAKDDQFKDIVIIDALSTPLGVDAFEQYVDYAALAQYYSSNDKDLSANNSKNAKRILDTGWRDRLDNGAFIVHTYQQPDGVRYNNADSLLVALQNIVLQRFRYTFDFARGAVKGVTKGLNENMLKPSQMKVAIEGGANQKTRLTTAEIELITIPQVWNIPEYWVTHSDLNISKLKVAVDKQIAATFDERGGQISAGEIWDFFEAEFGFVPVNLYAFLAGFLLKEYANETYRCVDTNGVPEPMNTDKLAEMLNNYINDGGKNNYKPTYLVKMTPTEKAFYELTEKAWGIAPNSCSSVINATDSVKFEMRKLKLPCWCLREIDDAGVSSILEMYIALVKADGKTAHTIATDIGKLALSGQPSLGDNLAKLISLDNCQKAMREFLRHFDGGKIADLAVEIGAENTVLSDIQKMFEVENSCLWEKTTGENEIRRLAVEYGIVRESNRILSVQSSSLKTSTQNWRVKLNFIHISHETVATKYTALAKLADILYKIAIQADILPDAWKEYHNELLTNGQLLRDFLNNENAVFAEVYAPYLDGFESTEIAKVKGMLSVGMFTMSASDCNIKVKDKAAEYRKSQLKTQLFTKWHDNTRTKTPVEWSSRYETPILAMVSNSEFTQAKKLFETLTHTNPSDSEIQSALSFLDTAAFMASLGDADKRDEAFKSAILGKYSIILPDLQDVRKKLNHLSIETYEWFENPVVKTKIKELAEAEYNAGGYDKALHILLGKSGSDLQTYLERLVKGNITVGIEIIVAGGE